MLFIKLCKAKKIFVDKTKTQNILITFLHNGTSTFLIKEFYIGPRNVVVEDMFLDNFYPVVEIDCVTFLISYELHSAIIINYNLVISYCYMHCCLLSCT